MAELCDYFITAIEDPFAGTYCKLRKDHEGPHQPHYPPEEKWIVHQFSGGEKGENDDAYGPYTHEQARQVADYINTFHQTLGWARVMRLHSPSQAPGGPKVWNS